MSAGAAQGPRPAATEINQMQSRGPAPLAGVRRRRGLIRGAAQAANSLNLRKRPMMDPALDDCAQ